LARITDSLAYREHVTLPSLQPLVRAVSQFLSIAPVLLVLLAAPARPPWRSQVPALERAEVAVGGVPLVVEIARSGEAQQRGLGYRNGLALGTGMLFTYDEADEHTFWMKGMRFCLDIVWLSEDRVAGAAENICPAPAGSSDEDIPRARAPGPVRYVLEVPAGWLAANGLGAGSPVTIDLDQG